MYIRTHVTKNKNTDKKYTTYKLVESYRTPNGPRQRIVADLGDLSYLDKGKLKDLANRIEQIINGFTFDNPLFPKDEEIERLAYGYAEKIKLNTISETTVTDGAFIPPMGGLSEEITQKPEYKEVDISNVSVSETRSIGGEYICNESFKELGLEEILESLSFSESEIEIAKSLIISRMLNPGSELGTYDWLKQRSGLFELLGINFKKKFLRQFYRVSEKLSENSSVIERNLFSREQELFSFENKILLYDLTNTHFEGNLNGNVKARLGRSKQKRSDCPLVTLGLVLNEFGFPLCSKVYEGNKSEIKTLVDIVEDLSKKVNSFTKPTVVMDAGIASEDNLKKIKDAGYNYLAVSRGKAGIVDYEKGVDIQIKDDSYSVKGKLQVTDHESFLYINSEKRSLKELAIKDKFIKRFEDGLLNIRLSLSKKSGIKAYDKVLERIGALKNRCSKVSQYYNVEVIKDEYSNKVADIRCEYDHKKASERLNGSYLIRTSLLGLSEQEIWDIYSMLNDVESTFRTLKGELGLRPVYHRKESAVDGHLFISVLAYHLVHNLRRNLKSEQIHYSWKTIREKLSNHIRVTVSMVQKGGDVIRLRVTSTTEEIHKEIYRALGYSGKILRNKNL